MRANGRGLHLGAQAAVAVAAAVLVACSTQPAYVRPNVPLATQWDNGGGASVDSTAPADWWTILHDPAIDGLVAIALLDNPTLGEAVARVDEARGHCQTKRADASFARLRS